MEDITDADYKRKLAKRVCKDSEIKSLGEYHYLYVQSDISLLADVFENFFSALRLAQKAAFKKAKLKVDFLTDVYMLLIIEKGIRRGICHSIHQYAEANKKQIKDYDQKKEQ